MVRTCERGRDGGGRRARDVSRLFLLRFCRCARSARKGGIRGARDAHLYAWRRALESRSSETPRTWSAADLFIALALVSPSQMEHSFETTTLDSKKASLRTAGNEGLRRASRANREATCRASIRTGRVW